MDAKVVTAHAVEPGEGMGQWGQAHAVPTHEHEREREGTKTGGGGVRRSLHLPHTAAAQAPAAATAAFGTGKGVGAIAEAAEANGREDIKSGKLLTQGAQWQVEDEDEEDSPLVRRAHASVPLDAGLDVLW